MKIRLFTSAFFVLFISSIFGQYTTVYRSSKLNDSYKKDSTYLLLKDSQQELINKINEFRDTIILSKRIPEQDKLIYLQLVNNLFDEPGKVSRFMYKSGDQFPWFQICPKDKVKDMVNGFNSNFYNIKLIEEIYNNIESNVFILQMKKLPKNIKKAIKYLKLNKNKDRASVYIKGLTRNIGIDKCLRNKDVYFTKYFYGSSGFNRMEWSHEFYINKYLGKRGNRYFNYYPGDSIQIYNEKFDYIIYAMSTISPEFFKPDYQMLKKGGKIYLKIRYLTEEEYTSKHKEKDEYHFTRAKLSDFLSHYDLELESERMDGIYTKYVFQKN